MLHERSNRKRGIKMAISSLSSFLHAPFTEATNTYGLVVKTGGAIEAKVAVNYNDSTIYSDGILKKKNTTFKDGKVSLIVDYANKTILSPLLGRVTEAISFTPAAGATEVTSTKHISNTGDKPIPVGFGYIVSDYDVENEKDVFTVKFFYKVEFQPYTQDAKTKEGTIAYTYTALEGTIFELDNGNWCEESDFETLAIAVEYLNSLYDVAI